MRQHGPQFDVDASTIAAQPRKKGLRLNGGVQPEVDQHGVTEPGYTSAPYHDYVTFPDATVIFSTTAI